MEKPHLRHAVLCLNTEDESSSDNYLSVIDPVYARASLSRDDAEAFKCLLVASVYLPDRQQSYDLEMTVQTPDGDTIDLCKDKINFGGQNYHKVICPLDFLLTGLGTYWFRISLDGEFAGGTSLLVKANF